MNEIYGLAIKRRDKNDYCIPMPLEEIDALFIQYSKETILKQMKENDSVITESNPNNVVIKKYQNGKWIDKNIEIITDSIVLEFSLPELFQNEQESNKLLNILSSHFKHYLEKDYVREEFKQAILATKKDKDSFLEKIKYLNYSELRRIRLCLYKACEPKKEKVETLTDYLLQRKAS